MQLLGRHGGTAIRGEGLSGENLNALPDKERQPAKPAGNRPSRLSADFGDVERSKFPALFKSLGVQRVVAVAPCHDSCILTGQELI